jgi:hypothetical protein
MVFDVTIRPLSQVGLQPGGGLKRFTGPSLWPSRIHALVHAGRAVALHKGLEDGGWAASTGGQLSNRRVSVGLQRALTRRTLLCVVVVSRDSRMDMQIVHWCRLRVWNLMRRPGGRFETELSIASRGGVVGRVAGERVNTSSLS